MHVALRHAELLVAREFLDCPPCRSTHREMGTKRVAKDVDARRIAVGFSSEKPQSRMKFSFWRSAKPSEASEHSEFELGALLYPFRQRRPQ
jgi:hypothetical protein